MIKDSNKLACFLTGIFPLHATFLLPVIRLDSSCFPGSIECCFSNAAYEWCQIHILLCAVSIMSLSSLWVPPLLKSVNLTHMSDYSGLKKQYIIIKSSQGGCGLLGCPKYSDFFYSVFKYIFILDSVAFEFGVNWTHSICHCWFESINITITFLTPSCLAFYHETRFEIHFDIRGFGLD